MLIFRLSGGLGNQFFSFAAGYRFCREKGEVFGLDVSTQCADWFFRDFDLANYDIRYDKEVLYRLGDNRMDHYLWKWNAYCPQCQIPTCQKWVAFWKSMQTMKFLLP